MNPENGELENKQVYWLKKSASIERSMIKNTPHVWLRQKERKEKYLPLEITKWIYSQQ